MTSIDPDLYRRLQQILLDSGSFESDSKLKALFADGRIAPWTNQVPQVKVSIEVDQPA